MSDTTVRTRRIFRVVGVVQGVGFRPFVFRLARRFGIAGWARNTPAGVEIDAEGPAGALERFAAALATDAPELARVEDVEWVEAVPAGYTDFRIAETLDLDPVQTEVPADTSVCDECLRETFDSSSRRAGYPFTNCTLCGPRFTIIERIPYCRSNTTMRTFRMCDECRAEYLDPDDRRFHAEPIACPACGPRIRLDGFESEDAVATAARLLREGKIVAIKGLGGFHLACDARSEETVRELRQRKRRAAKPFAVMVRDLEEAAAICELGNDELGLLTSRLRPIVIAPRKPGSGVAESVAPGTRLLGVMLPYTPLHALILSQSPPALVMTSGNLAEEPLAFTNDSARARLRGIADAFLTHDRDILAPCDDSVVRQAGPGLTVVIRRARGYVPESIAIPVRSPETVLACGADQKNTFCIAFDDRAVMSQHIGDLEGEENFEYFIRTIEHFETLTGRRPGIVAHDLHPNYRSTRYALQRPADTRIGVQHHHAHIAGCLAENSRTGPCIGVAFDGTGLGTDGTVWGGEILVADLGMFFRAGHFAQVRMPGGEAAVRDPRKMAAAYLYAAFGNEWKRLCDALGLDFSELEVEMLERQFSGGLNSPVTSSAGRLFDAVSAAVGICRQRTYEGQPAVELESAARPCADSYPVRIDAVEGTVVMDGVSVFRAAVEDRLNGTSPAVIAGRFQNAVVELAAAACAAVRERITDWPPIPGSDGPVGALNADVVCALSGGVFQNAYILTRLRDRLSGMGFEVLVHRRVPPNDGGISFGQATAAAARLCSGEVS